MGLQHRAVGAAGAVQDPLVSAVEPQAVEGVQPGVVGDDELAVAVVDVAFEVGAAARGVDADHRRAGQCTGADPERELGYVVEQDADVVALLYKPSSGEDDDGAVAEEADGAPVNLLIAKQRNGPTGDVHLTFLKPYTRFESAAKVSDDDMPGQ